MRRLVLIAALSVVPSLARADVAPDPDPWEACEGFKIGDACYSEEGMGYCVEKMCPDASGKTCLYCDPDATATTGPSTTGSSSGGGSSGSGGSGGSSGGSSDGDTTDGTPAKDKGCGCRSDSSPAGALALIGILLFVRRRRA